MFLLQELLVLTGSLKTLILNLFACQYDEDPLDYHSGSWAKLKDVTGYSAPPGVTTFDPSCMLGFYGRMWAGGITEENDVLYYSKLIDAS